jgi:UV DNA damage endonuclease
MAAEEIMKFGLCCISLNLQEQDNPIKFQTMTFKRFSSLPRDEALSILGDRILNNMEVTNEIINYCHRHNFTYRISSDLFPLITYDQAGIDLEDLPNYDDIQDSFDDIEETIANTGVRISCHPSEYNVLASTNEQAVEKTITELNFYSSFMDRIGCEADYNSPINLHIHNKDGTYNDITNRFLRNFNRLDSNCRNRMVIENDDKLGCWSVKELISHFHPKANIPITFDYLHHDCHPDGLSEHEAINECYKTWGDFKPLFHYSESKPGNNPRAHADYANKLLNTHGLDFDLDMELKMKDKAILKYQEDNYGKK